MSVMGCMLWGMPAKPHNELSAAILGQVWPDITPSMVYENAKVALKNKALAEEAASGARYAVKSVLACEEGFFAEASAQAYSEEEGMLNDLVEAHEREYRDLIHGADIIDWLMNRLFDIDAVAHDVLKQIEPERSQSPAKYGADKMAIIMTGMWLAEEASTEACAQLMVIVAKIPTEYEPSYKPPVSKSNAHRNSATPVDQKIGTGGELPRDHQGMQQPCQGPRNNSNLGKNEEFGNNRRDSEHQIKSTNMEADRENHTTNGEPSDRQGKLSDVSTSPQQAGIGSIGGQGLSLSPMAAPSGGMGSGAGIGSGSGASGLSGWARPMSSPGGFGGNGVPQMSSSSTPSSGGPIQDFAKGFNSGGGVAPPASVARPMMPAEGGRSPMPPMNALSGAVLSSGNDSIASGPVSAQSGAGAIPVSPMASPAAGGGTGGPLPPFGSDMRGASSGSGAAGTTAGGTPPPSTGTTAPATSTGNGAEPSWSHRRLLVYATSVEVTA
jgi:hypothetical protein